MIHNFDEIINRTNTGARKWDAYSEDILPMWVADTDFAVPEPIVRALKERMEHPIFGYPTNTESFKEAVAYWQETRFGWAIEPQWVQYASGIVNAAVCAMLAFTGMGDTVVTMNPMYTPYHTVVPNNGRRIKYVDMELENGEYAIDWDHFEKLLSDVRTSMLILCNPHNPIGKVYTEEELERIVALCVKHKVFIVSDEVHGDLVFSGHTHIPLGKVKGSENLDYIVCINPSKTFNIAGLRSGAYIAPSLSVREKLYTMMDEMRSFGYNTFGPLALEVAYKECEYYADQLRDYLEVNRDYACKFINEEIPGIFVHAPSAMFLLWLDCRDLGMTQEELFNFFLEKAKVAPSNGNTFDVLRDGFIRLNIGYPRAILEEGLKRIKEAVKAM